MWYFLNNQGVNNHMAKRVSVGILASHHQQLADIGNKTGHKLAPLVDKAIANWLETEAPVWLRAAEQLTKKRPNTK